MGDCTDIQIEFLPLTFHINLKTLKLYCVKCGWLPRLWGAQETILTSYILIKITLRHIDIWHGQLCGLADPNKVGIEVDLD